MQYYLVEDISHYCNVILKKCSPLHPSTIPYYDFSFILEGSAVYYADGVRIVLQKNDAVFLPPRTIRSREARDESLHFVSFNFTAPEGVEFPFPAYMPGCITADIRKLVSLYPPSHLSSFYHAKEKCVNMLNYILFELLDASELKCDNEHVMKILYYIEEHITEDLTLHTISKVVNLSREYTSYIFKKETGKTLTAYVNERKLLLAKELILGGEMSLVDVAHYLGYDNYNYFCRMFKRYLETTPMGLRQKG